MFRRIMPVSLMSLVPVFVSLGASSNAGSGGLQPLLLASSYQHGKALEELPPWPASMIVRPLAHHSFVNWYKGPELTAMVYEASDGVISVTDMSYDEHSRVLHGTALLTSANGEVHKFHTGDTFVVPRGWSGTWEFSDGYREELTFYTKSLDEAMKSLFGK